MATMRCEPIPLGVGIGVILAVYVFLLGIIAMWGWGETEELVGIISKLYMGYTPTFLGSIIGAIWAFVDGFIAGVVIAWIYNKFQK